MPRCGRVIRYLEERLTPRYGKNQEGNILT